MPSRREALLVIAAAPVAVKALLAAEPPSVVSPDVKVAASIDSISRAFNEKLVPYIGQPSSEATQAAMALYKAEIQSVLERLYYEPVQFSVQAVKTIDPNRVEVLVEIQYRGRIEIQLVV